MTGQPQRRTMLDVGGLSIRALAPVAALAAAACGDGGGGGGGSGGTGGSSPVPMGPKLACEPGDIDLGVVSGPGLTLVPLGSVMVDRPITALGVSAFGSDPVSICVPPDAVSLCLYADEVAEAGPISWVGSGLGELIDSSTPQAWVRAATPELSLPKSPDVALHAGRQTFVLAHDVAGPVNPRIAIRRGTRESSGSFALNLVLVLGSGIDATNSDAFVQASGVLEQIYAQANVLLGAVGVGAIEDPALAVVSQSSYAPLVAAPVAWTAEAPMQPNAVTLYLVREILSQDTAGTLLGQAMAIPGIPALDRKRGVVISVDAHRVGPAIDFGALWVTVAHELGHWHGLRHTTERWGTPQDYVADTPECTAQNDFDKNGLVDMVECSKRGADNLMFWTYDLDSPPTQLVAGQGFVLQSALTVSP